MPHIALYRFDTKQPDFPVTIEIFSKVPDILRFEQKGHLTPLPLDGAESLSAICLDDDHYDFIQKGKKEISGVSCLGPEYLIPLKGFAWLKLNELNIIKKTFKVKTSKNT